jgi:ribonuclease HI
MKNFIWSGDLNQRKLVTVGWKKVCKPFAEGGLGIRSIITLNEASNLKLCWDLINSQDHWALLLKSRVIRGQHCIRHHIFSSIWCGMKNEFNVIWDNSSFIIGNGKDISFWTDKWCAEDSIADILHLPVPLQNNLQAKVADFIQGSQWFIPVEIDLMFPLVKQLVNNIQIPLEDKPDLIIWRLADSGDLSLKAAFQFKCHSSPQLHWAKIVWSNDIPPSKSLVAWRLMHDKLPTDISLICRGCFLPSVCSLCMCRQESTFHLFFECPFAVHIWSWFSSVIGINLHFQSIEDIWKVCDRNWNPQCKVVITASLVNIFSTIWFARNQKRFMDKNFHWKTAINMISANVLLSGNKTRKVFNSSMRDFSILKKFKIDIHPPKAPSIKEVLWCPPRLNWMKCNTDGAATTETASYGGIFRDHLADFRGGFAENIGKNSAFFAEILGAIRAIEIAFQNHWYNLWLETDSALVVKAFSNQALIPWQLRNRCLNSLVRTRNMNFFVSHIYREGNECADAFANLGLGLVNFVYWNDVPQPVHESLARNKMGFPCYRFSH